VINESAAAPLVGLDYAQLYRDYAARMHVVARRFFRCEQECADAVQDAFLAAIESGHRFRGRSQAWTWLYRILLNVCLMRLRRRIRRATISLNPFVDAPEGDRSAASRSLADDSHAARCDQRETLAHIQRALDALPEGHRRIIQLRDLEERDTRETSALLGISRSAVKTGLHRARRTLRTELVRRRVADA
jgi:RNA polymerase sigma-70 factor (ECF subfamily)